MKRLAFQFPENLNLKVYKVRMEILSNALRITYNDNQNVTKSFSWLRDHSFENINNSGQKMYTSAQCSEIQPLKSYLENSDVVIHWPRLSPHHDGIHQIENNEPVVSKYSIKWLIQGNRTHDFKLPDYKLWKSDLKIEKMFVDYDDFMKMDFHKTVNTLYDYGLVILKKCPEETGTIEDIALKFGPLYDSFYGKTWDVVNNADKAINVAYTAGELGLHMDLMYFKDSPGLQILHCLKNSSEGGENIFSDAHQAALELKDIKIGNVSALDVLQRVNVTYEYHSPQHWMKFSRPIVQMSPTGELQQVSYSPPFQGVLFVKDELSEAWYKALYEFEAKLSKNMISYKLENGEAAIFVNNRITHGRRGFKGDRHLRGAYVSMCAFLDKYREKTREMLRYRFDATKTIEPFYSGGTTQIVEDCILATYFSKVSCFKKGDLQQIEMDDDQITCFYKGSSSLIIASKSLQLGIYNNEYELQRQMKTTSLLTSCTIDDTGVLAAFGGSDGIIHVYDLNKRYYTHKFTGHRSLVTKLKFLIFEDTLYLLSCGDDGTVRVWNLKTSRSFIFKHHDALIRNAVVRNNILLIISRDQTISLWQFDKVIANFNVQLEEVLISTVAVEETVETGDFLTDEVFYVGGESGKLKLWNINDLNGAFKIINVGEPIYDSHLIKDGLCIVSQFQNFFNLQISEELDISVISHVIGYNDEVLQVGLLDNDILCATNSNDLRLFCRNGESKLLKGHSDVITCFDVHSNKVLSGSKDNTMKLWDYDPMDKSLSSVSDYHGHVGTISSCCFSKSAELVYSVSSDLTLKCWNMNGICQFTIKAHDKDINCVKVSPNNQMVATASQDKSIKLWNAANGELITALQGHKRSVWFCSFSLKEKALVSGSGDMTVKLWSLTEQTCIRTLEGHFQSILYVDFFNNGTQIISSGSDGLIKIWDKQSGAELQTIEAHEGKVWGCCVTDNDEEIISGGTDAKITIYKDTTKEHQENELKEKEIEIEQNQAIDNMVRGSDYIKALEYCAELKMPGKFMEIFKIAYNKDPAILKMVGALDLSEFMQNWLSYHKHQFYGQMILNQMLLENKEVDAKGLLGLTEKQFNRLDQLLIDMHILKITHLQSVPIQNKKFKIY